MCYPVIIWRMMKSKVKLSKYSFIITLIINMICYRFEELKEAENELLCKSKEFNIDVRALDKRYEKIDNIRNIFYIFTIS